MDRAVIIVIGEGCLEVGEALEGGATDLLAGAVMALAGMAGEEDPASAVPLAVVMVTGTGTAEATEGKRQALLPPPHRPLRRHPRKRLEFPLP